MRLHLPIAAIAASVFASSSVNAAPASKFKSPTGRVTYKLSSPMMNGSTTLSWMENGKKFRQDMSGEVVRPSQPGQPPAHGMQIKTWTLSDGVNIYSKQPMNDSILRIKIPKDKKGISPSPLMPTGLDTAKVVGKETLLGKQCQIRQIQAQGNAVKVWIWDGVPLKMQSSGQQSMSMVATKVEVPARLDAAKFKLPAGAKVQDFNLPTGGGAPGRPGPR